MITYIARKLHSRYNTRTNNYIQYETQRSLYGVLAPTGSTSCESGSKLDWANPRTVGGLDLDRKWIITGSGLSPEMKHSLPSKLVN